MGLDETLETLWERLLSGQAEVIRSAYLNLDTQARAAMIAHLRRMVSEEGWHPRQQESARTALETIEPANPNVQNLSD